MNNEKEFSLGFILYADDYRGNYLPFSNNGITYQAGGFYEVPTLDPNWDAFSGLSIAMALTNAMDALKNSLVYPYIKNVNVFHCPGDRRITQSTGLGYGDGFAFCGYSKSQNFAGDPNQNDEYWGMGTTISKPSDVTAPSMTFMAVEDTDWRGFDVGTWVVNWSITPGAPGAFQWVDPLAMNHVDVDLWVFVDDHVESHQWTDQNVIQAGVQASLGVDTAHFSAATSGPDYDYIRNRLRFPGWQ
jgi:hypothetical protein